jgi:hypothetical protein
MAIETYREKDRLSFRQKLFNDIKGIKVNEES